MSGERGGKRSLSAGAYNPRRTFIAYLACVCCGHWWPLSEVALKALIDPARLLCPFCAEGRKRACAGWDGKSRRLPVPARLDVRLPAAEENA
jgi:hypothetical protein